MAASRFVRRFSSLLLLLLATSGCGHFVARQIAQSPNIYPAWLAPTPRVQLAFESIFLTNFPPHFVKVGPPAARLRYRIVEPADYQCVGSATNWLRAGRTNFQFTFKAKIPGMNNAWTDSPRGTVVLLHGYGVGEFALAPWALRLAEEGWRCVLLDLRGHGKSTGRQIYYSIQETHDLSQLLDELDRNSRLSPPVHAFGDSYGAALALRWKMNEPRVTGVIAISPYASLSNAILNICREYADWTPEWMIRAGLKELPAVLHVAPGELDPAVWLARTPVKALFVAGENDRVVSVAEIRSLCDAAASGSQLVILPGATHEALPYFFEELIPPVLGWLDRETVSSRPEPKQ